MNQDILHNIVGYKCNMIHWHARGKTRWLVCVR